MTEENAKLIYRDALELVHMMDDINKKKKNYPIKELPKTEK